MKRSAFIVTAALAASLVTPAAYAMARTDDGTADLSLTLTGQQTAQPGQQATYQATVHNAGPDAATDLRMELRWNGYTFSHIDSLSGLGPGMCFQGTDSAVCDFDQPLASGATKTFTIVGRVGAHVAPTQIDLNAKVSAKPADGDMAGNTGRVVTGVGPAADLGVKLTGPATVKRGDWITYEATVANQGGVAGTGSKLLLRLPGGVSFTGAPLECGVSGFDVSCDLGDLAVKGTKTIQVSGKVDGDVPIGRKLDALARVQSGVYDSVPGDNQVSSSATVVQPVPAPAVPKANVVITGKVTPLHKGRNGTYAIVVANKGPNAAKNVSVGGVLPKGLTFKAVRGCHRAKNGIKCLIPNLKAGGKVTIVLSVKVAKSAKGNMIFTVSARAATKDPVPANNVVRIRRIVTK